MPRAKPFTQALLTPAKPKEPSKSTKEAVEGGVAGVEEAVEEGVAEAVMMIRSKRVMGAGALTICGPIVARSCAPTKASRVSTKML
jgi:hypothetical protein